MEQPAVPSLCLISSLLIVRASAALLPCGLLTLQSVRQYFIVVGVHVSDCSMYCMQAFSHACGSFVFHFLQGNDGTFTQLSIGLSVLNTQELMNHADCSSAMLYASLFIWFYYNLMH